MKEYKTSISWMKEVFTAKQLENILDQVDKLAEKERKEGKRVGIQEHDILTDKLLVQKRNNELDIPFNVARYPVTEHFTKITENLFFAYPYYFDSEQFVALAKDAKEAGFNVRVDPYASRLVGGNFRVIIWRQNQKNAKK